MALLASLCACTEDPTEVLVVVDTDLPADAPIAISVTARRGNPRDAGGVFAPDRVWSRVDGGPASDGAATFRSFPISFAVRPAVGDSLDEPVTLVVQADSNAAHVRRTMRFHFEPHRIVVLPIFLTAQCLAPDDGCGSMAPCTRQSSCESRGETCGDDGRCVSVDRTPSAGDAGATPCSPCSPTPSPICEDDCTQLTFRTSGSCGSGLCRFAASRSPCAFGCETTTGACRSPGDACAMRTCGSSVACGGTCVEGSGCCTTSTYQRSSGQGSGVVTVCCDPSDTITSVVDCAVGMNHSATQTSASCAQGAEGAMNGGTCCAQIDCAHTVCR